MDNGAWKPLLSADEKEAIENYFEVENKFTVGKAYSKGEWADRILNKLYRRKAVSTIAKYAPDFDASIPYLAMYYFDRLTITQEFHHDFDENMNLVAVCCLGVAWKMRHNDFSYNDFLARRPSLQINKDRIGKMETKVLKGIKHEAFTITALSFVVYLFDKLQGSCNFSLQKVYEIIIQAQGDVKYTKFQPSVIAASAILATSMFLQVDHFEIFKNRLIDVRNAKLKWKELESCTEAFVEMCGELGIFREEDNMCKVLWKLHGSEIEKLCNKLIEEMEGEQPSRNDMPLSPTRHKSDNFNFLLGITMEDLLCNESMEESEGEQHSRNDLPLSPTRQKSGNQDFSPGITDLLCNESREKILREQPSKNDLPLSPTRQKPDNQDFPPANRMEDLFCNESIEEIEGEQTSRNLPLSPTRKKPSNQNFPPKTRMEDLPCNESMEETEGQQHSRYDLPLSPNRQKPVNQDLPPRFRMEGLLCNETMEEMEGEQSSRNHLPLSPARQKPGNQDCPPGIRMKLNLDFKLKWPIMEQELTIEKVKAYILLSAPKTQ